MNPTDAADTQAFLTDSREDPEQGRDTAILTHFNTDLAGASGARDEGGRESDWDSFFRKYLCELDSGKLPWKSKVFDPEPFAAIETVGPRVTNTLLGGPEIFGVKPTGQEDVKKARKNKILLDWQADHMNLYQRLGDMVKDGLIYGTSFGMVRWRKEFEPRMTQHPVLDALGHPIIDEQTGQPMLKWEKEFVLVYDDPWVERVDIKSLYVDATATCVEDARFIIHETQRTRDYLKKKEAEGIYRNIDLIKDGDTSGTTDQQTDPRKAVNDEPSNAKTIEVHDKQMELVTLYSYYGQYDIDDDGYLEECIIVVANGNTVIRADYNPFPGGFKPFVRFTPIPIPGSFYGMSFLKPIDGITDALNDRTNQIADNINILLNPMFKRNRHADIDDNQCVSSPGGIIDMNQMTDLEQLAHQDIIGSVWPELGRLENKIQKATGVYDYAAGSSPQRQEAATTVISLQQVAEIRFRAIAILFERQIIRPLGNMLLKLNKEFMGKQRQVRIIGQKAMMDYQEPEFEQITPQDIVDNPDIYAVGASVDPSMSKQIQLEKLMGFLQIIAGNPQLAMNPLFGIDWSVVIEEIPYLLDLKLKRPLIMPLNPMVAYQEMQNDNQMADGMLMSQMAQMGQMAMGGEQPGESVPDKSEKSAPSRTKGELSKRDKKKAKK